MNEWSPQGRPAQRATLPDAELVLTQLDELPTLSAIAVKLLHLTTSVDSRTEEVCALVRNDQSLTAKVLSVANSAATGVREPVTTVDRAVVLLGFDLIRNVVLTTKVFEHFGPQGEHAEAFDRREFWRHTLAVAAAAGKLAELSPQLGVLPGAAFVGGLLHDVGKVALDAVYPKAYGRIAAMAAEAHGDIADAERQLLGVDHTVAGRHIAERWKLPALYRDVAWLHHLAPESLPASVQAGNVIALVQLADTYVREQRLGHSGNHAFYDSSATLAGRLNLRPDALEQIERPVVEEVAKWSSLLGLDSDTPEAVYLSALTTANSELAKLYTDLSASNRRLSGAARYYRALTAVSEHLTPGADVADVVRAMVSAAGIACQRSRVAAFGVRSQSGMLELAWSTDGESRPRSVNQALTDELREWLEDAGDASSVPVLRAPRVLRTTCTAFLAAPPGADLWLLPVVLSGELVGGILYLSEQDERQRLSGEHDDLRSFLTSLALALGQATAQAAAQRLSDELAENNRRLQQMHGELLRTRTLASIAEMAAGAGHELNGPLAVISGRAQMLLARQSDPRDQRSLSLVIEKAHECSRIVKELMDFAKPRPLEPQRADVGALLQEVLRDWQAESGVPEGRVVVQLAEDLPAVEVDTAQARVALQELLRNAAEATAQNEGLITVSARRGVAARLVEIVVRDTGYGMTQAVQRRAFDPFFSHRQAGRGRGLGLPRAHRIIDGHGGSVWIESRPGEGTSVHVLLPVAGVGERLMATPPLEGRPQTQ